MPFNLSKVYPELLELLHLDNRARIKSLRRIFERDIENNEKFIFNRKFIRPIKKDDGQSAMDTLFQHLTHEENVTEDENGRTYKSRNIFEIERSKRLHWIKYLIEHNKLSNIEIFSVKERDQKKRKDIIITYLYDTKEKYVIVLQPQRSNTDYYLLSAYFLNKSWGVKNMNKKLNKKLTELF